MILEVQNISKKFKIYHETLPYETLRSKLMNPMRFFVSRKQEEFWALKNISFKVAEGESIGIIGKNGAGKSTLLKVLSKITPPSGGRIISRGRIASLLEVGTGFHPELTGRENIFLNGSILGMKRKEIYSQFDNIIDFAGVEKFLDTQLKHYSSGMQLRLAFSVAAFLNPEILVIDEVLAVGDADFQKKCIDKMQGVTRSGRTILFVSHQMGLINQLCSRAILLDKGTVKDDGPPERITAAYLSLSKDSGGNIFTASAERKDTNTPFISKALTISSNGEPRDVFGYNEEIGLRIFVQSPVKINDEILSVALLDKYGNRVFTNHQPIISLQNSGPEYTGTMYIPREIIAPNFYSFHFAVVKKDGRIFDIHENKCQIQIADTGTDFSQYEGKDYGSIILNCRWN